MPGYPSGMVAIASNRCFWAAANNRGFTPSITPIDEQIKERAVPSQSFSIEEAKEFILNNEEYDERFHAATRGAAQGLANKNYTHEQIETEITGWLMKAPSKGSSQWNRRIAELDNDIQSAFRRIQSEKPRKKSLPELQLEKPGDFPWELVPEDLRVAAQEMARVIKVAPEATLVGLISAVMACMGKRIPIYEKPYMQMYASLGFLVVLPAGERKSAIVNMIMRTLFFPIKKRLIKEWKTEKAKARAVNKDVEKHLKALEKVEPEWGNTEYENHIAEVAKWELRRSDVREKKPVFQIDNATEEYLENQINDNGGEIWVASGEARSIINNIAGRYNKSGDTSEGAYLKGIANDPISRGRVTTGDSECEMSCLNLLMYAQPDAVYKLTDHGTLSASGLFGRILTIAPPSMVGSRLEEKDEAPFDSSKLAGIGAAMNKAIDITDVEIHLSPDAAEARRLYHNRIEKEMGRGGIFEGEAEIVNKMCTGAFKLASALHFINAKDSITSSQNEFIPKQTFVNASELFDWFMKQNLQMIRYRKEQSIVEVAHEILKHMCSAKSADVLSVHGWFTEGRFKNTFLGTTSKKLYFVDALNMLEEYGHIELKKGKKGYEFREVKS